jgi:hypothetical protein
MVIPHSRAERGKELLTPGTLGYRSLLKRHAPPWPGEPRYGRPWGTRVVVDGEEHDMFEWVSFAEARRRCQPAELQASFLAGCETAGFGSGS